MRFLVHILINRFYVGNDVLQSHVFFFYYYFVVVWKIVK